MSVKFVFLGALTLIASSSSAWATAITDLNQIPGSAFGYYSLVATGTKNSLQLTSDTGITGNVAIGSDGISLQGGGTTIHGNLDYQGSNTGSGITVTGATSTNVTNAGNAIADAQSLAMVYGGVTGLTTWTDASLNVSTNAGTAYKGNTNEHVYALGTGFTTDLTITAAADQYVIFDVGASSSANWSLVAVSLNGGITSDHVLFNVETTGQLSAGNAHSQAVNAIVIDNSGDVNVDNFTLDGRLFCTSTKNNCQVVSNADIVSSVSLQSATPEPSTMILFGGALTLLGFMRRKPAR